MANDLLFTMIQINDVHLMLDDDRRNTQGKLRALSDRVGRGGLAPAPDVTLLAGDLVDLPEEPPLRRFLELSAPLLGGQVLAVPGNHDVAPPEDPPRDAAYWRLLPAHPLGEVVRFRGVRFILLNDADGDRRSAPWIQERNCWLAAELGRAAEPTIIAAHVALISLRDLLPLATSFDFPTWKNQDPEAEFLHIIERHADSVIAVLSGHIHLTAHVERGGIHHIAASGLMSWPYDAAFYEFFPNKIEVRMVSLPEDIDPGEEMARWPLRNGIHDRHGREFTDSRHPTMEEYIRGRADERAFTIALKGKKAIRNVK